jgi:hypothetical protein
VLRPYQLYELEEYGSGKSGTDKRWCYAFFTGDLPDGRTPYMEAVFTLEWMNEADNRWWLQIRTSGATCRGYGPGNPWDDSRCK